MKAFQIVFQPYSMNYVVWKEDTDGIFKKVFEDIAKDECEFYIMGKLGYEVTWYGDYRMTINDLGFITNITLKDK